MPAVAYVRKQKDGMPDDNTVRAEDDASVKDKDVVKETPKDPAKDAPKDSKEAKGDKAKLDTMAAEEVTQPQRARVDTVGMPIEALIGKPPDMPAAPPIAATPLATAVEQPTQMPGPRAIPSGEPGDAAAAPGSVPRGDSRSLRRSNEFALIYRQANAVISRFGTVGTRGQWRVVEYPTTASASHAYAKECSRFVSEGYSDYRE
jgi:predicted DNA-binding WGR domain protein